VPTGDAVLDVERRAFDHWTDAELQGGGFDEQEIADLRACGDEYDLLNLRWPTDRLDLALTLVERTPEQVTEGEEDRETRLREAIDAFGGLSGISPLFTPEELEAIAKAPIEDWMVFLHPDQRSLVTRSFAGPARVRGAAGTGKTVVALHRAAHLAVDASPDEPVLFATVTSSLPRVLEQLHRRMPGAKPDGVAFRAVGDVAIELLAGAGRKVELDPGRARAALDEVAPELADLSVGVDYLYDELSRLIAGRGLMSVDDYVAASRAGRRQALAEPARQKVWAIYEAWRARLAELGVADTPIAAHQALASVRAGEVKAPAHAAVVVDEAQDLTMAELLLLRLIANRGGRRDRPDGLMLVGDGAQRVQAGGYTLRSVGVEVRGRTAVLRVNYRSTAEIVQSAFAVAGDDIVLDLDEELRRGEAAPVPRRHGVRPRGLTFADDAAEFDGLVRLIDELGSSELISTGDIGVFVPPLQAGPTVAALRDRGVEVLAVTDYDGTPGREVKVGAHADAKGLEFKAVILPRLSDQHFPSPAAPGDSAGVLEERASLELSRLFVAMTRARDMLVVTCAGAWSDHLARAKEAFDLS
jgi:superfamily I DNA/RNA helicase